MGEIIILTLFLVLFLYMLVGIIKREVFIWVPLYPSYIKPRNKKGILAVIWGLIFEFLIIIGFFAFITNYTVQYNFFNVLLSIFVSAILVFFIKKIEQRKTKLSRSAMKNFVRVLVLMVLFIYSIVFILFLIK